MMTGIVVVSFHNAEGTKKYVTEQLSQLTDEYRVIIVAVDAEEEYGINLAESCGLEYIRNYNKINNNSKGWCVAVKDNLGYAKGNNLGVKILKKSNIVFDYYLFSNDDIEIIDSDILSRLGYVLNMNDYIGGIGPRVIGIDGNDQSPHRKYISPQRQIGWKLFSFIRKKRNHNAIYSDNTANTVAEASLQKRNNNSVEDALILASKASAPEKGLCYWISGAFMMVKANKFDTVEGFDSRTFLYFEEVILAERFLKKGWNFAFEPSVKVIHYEGGSTNVKSSRRNAIELESRLLYYREYKHVNRILLFLYKLIEKIL